MIAALATGPTLSPQEAGVAVLAVFILMATAWWLDQYEGGPGGPRPT